MGLKQSKEVMPSYRCQHPTCPTLLPSRGYCPSCTAMGRASNSNKAQADKRYDKEKRDKRSKAFYNSKAWKQTRINKLSLNPLCERCTKAFASEVHHRQPLRTHWDRRLDMGNLIAYCKPCHSIVEGEKYQPQGGMRWLE
jgi:5-methylcytosine-specific restriction protein A